MGFPGGGSGQNMPANVKDIRDAGSIPGWGRSLGGGHETCSSVLAWRIPCTEDSGGLHSTRLQRVGLCAC